MKYYYFIIIPLIYLIKLSLRYSFKLSLFYLSVKFGILYFKQIQIFLKFN